jgi:hypothetical protein
MYSWSEEKMDFNASVLYEPYYPKKNTRTKGGAPQYVVAYFSCSSRKRSERSFSFAKYGSEAKALKAANKFFYKQYGFKSELCTP